MSETKVGMSQEAAMIPPHAKDSFRYRFPNFGGQ
jgi:hypothetical protein